MNAIEASKQKIRVMCVDDHAFLVEGLKSRLLAEPDLEFAGSLHNLERVAEEAQRLQASIVLVDIEIPGPDVFEVILDLARRCPSVRPIVLSAYVRDHYIDSALAAGAWGYLSKSDDPASIMEGIRKVASGDFAFGPEVAQRVGAKDHRASPAAPASAKPATKLHLLTPREQQILRMIGRGHSRVEIAKTIHRSPKTVDAHRASVMDKLGIHDRVELARYAIREGLVEA